MCTEWSREKDCRYLPEDLVQLWEEIVVALMRARRIRSGGAGREMLNACGVRTQAEAQVLGALGVELHAGNQDGARSCYAALAEDGFVRPYKRVTL